MVHINYSKEWWIELINLTEECFNIQEVVNNSTTIQKNEIDLEKILGKESSLLVLFGGS